MFRRGSLGCNFPWKQRTRRGGKRPLGRGSVCGQIFDLETEPLSCFCADSAYTLPTWDNNGVVTLRWGENADTWSEKVGTFPRNEAHGFRNAARIPFIRSPFVQLLSRAYITISNFNIIFYLYVESLAFLPPNIPQFFERESGLLFE